jgi:hypothetical protein
MMNANPVDDLIELANSLWQFEGQYQRSSAEFYSAYQAGSLDDELQHNVEWAATYEAFLKTKSTVESSDEYRHYLDLLDDEADSQDPELAARMARATTLPPDGERFTLREYLRRREDRYS